MMRKLLAALCLSSLGVVAAPAANAHADCQFPVAVIAVFAPVTLICGDGNDTTTNHTTSVQVDPQISPHLFAPAPQGAP